MSTWCVRTQPLHSLDAEVRDAWSAGTGGEPTRGSTARWSRSPFYRLDLLRIIDEAYREGGVDHRIEVAVVESGAGDAPRAVAAVWPFEREAPRLAVPAGRFLNDYQGLIALDRRLLEQSPLAATELLAGCGLDRWRFDHVPVDQPVFGSRSAAAAVAPQIDLANGWDAYVAERSAIAKRAQYVRRLERAAGPVRVEHRSEDPNVLDTLLRWKSRQYIESGKRDLFAHAWCRLVAERIMRSRREVLSGELSALWAGDKLVAAHLGVRSHDVLHYWFPGYDSAFAKYSPGMVLLWEIARAAPERGITLIDLGKGDQQYKDRMANASVLVGQGVVEVRTPALVARHLARRARVTLRRVASTARR